MSDMERNAIKSDAEAIIKKWEDLIRMAGGYGNFRAIIARLRGLEMETRHIAEMAEYIQVHYPES
jgi:hypothetical protein